MNEIREQKMQIKNNNWECPVCNTPMGVNVFRGEFLTRDDHMLTPLLCPNCGMECWIKSVPTSIVVFNDFKDRLNK